MRSQFVTGINFLILQNVQNLCIIHFNHYIQITGKLKYIVKHVLVILFSHSLTSLTAHGCTRVPELPQCPGNGIAGYPSRKIQEVCSTIMQVLNVCIASVRRGEEDLVSYPGVRNPWGKNRRRRSSPTLTWKWVIQADGTLDQKSVKGGDQSTRLYHWPDKNLS